MLNIPSLPSPLLAFGEHGVSALLVRLSRVILCIAHCPWRCRPETRLGFAKGRTNAPRWCGKAFCYKLSSIQVCHVWGKLCLLVHNFVFRKFAFGHDDLSPTSESFTDGRNGWGASIVDALDTMVRHTVPIIFELIVNWCAVYHGSECKWRKYVFCQKLKYHVLTLRTTSLKP